jgi:hypothetical protein
MTASFDRIVSTILRASFRASALDSTRSTTNLAAT